MQPQAAAWKMDTRSRLRQQAAEDGSLEWVADMLQQPVSALRMKAAQLGVDGDELEDARDEDDPKAELVILIRAKMYPDPPTTPGDRRGEKGRG